MKKINRWLLLPIFCVVLFCTGCNKKAEPVNMPNAVSSYQEDKLNLDAKAALAFDLKKWTDLLC